MFIIVFITCANIKEAKNIASALVRAKLAACVNIVSNIQSIFWWEAKVDTVKETLLVIKTKKSLFKKLSAVVKSRHSYKVPEIVALPIVEGNKDYLDWISENTK